MSKCILIEVIDREIYTYQYNNLDDAQDAMVTKYNEFCEGNECDERDCKFNENWLTAWANGSYACADWQICMIE